jgi:hypothetical protein
LSHLQVSGLNSAFDVGHDAFPHLKKLIWNFLNKMVHLDGFTFPRTLKQLFIDRSCFKSACISREATEREYESGRACMLQSCRDLERLSIKDASYMHKGTTGRFPVTQSMLFKMVSNRVLRISGLIPLGHQPVIQR